MFENDGMIDPEDPFGADGIGFLDSGCSGKVAPTSELADSHGSTL